MNTAQESKVYVWDRLVRIFHWILVVAFTVAFLTEDDALTLHVWAGYIVGIVVVIRVLWGFVGPQHARFSDFVYKPATTFAYVADLLRLRAKRYLGHSPGGGAMVVLLLILLATTVVTGLIVYGGEHQAGPLMGIVSAQRAEALEGLHEAVANVTLAFVLAHIAAVVLASFVHRENLVWSNTSEPERGPDAIRLRPTVPCPVQLDPSHIRCRTDLVFGSGVTVAGLCRGPALSTGAGAAVAPKIETLLRSKRFSSVALPNAIRTAGLGFLRLVKRRSPGFA